MVLARASNALDLEGFVVSKVRGLHFFIYFDPLGGEARLAARESTTNPFMGCESRLDSLRQLIQEAHK